MNNVKLLILACMSITFVMAQNVGIGTNNPDASAKLDIESNNQGLLPPRLALSAINVAAPVASPAEGLIVYNTATAGTAPNNVSPGYYYWDGTKWERLKVGKNFDWYEALSTENPNSIYDYIYTHGYVGIGMNNPNDRLDVSGNGHVSGYLKVGNPTAPSVPFGENMLYSHVFTAGDGGWATSDACGGEDWTLRSSASEDEWLSAAMRWDNETGNSADYLLSPWIWIPNSYYDPTFSMYTFLQLETGWDGCYLEYTTNGSTWTKVNTFSVGGYQGNASLTSCVGGNQPAWTNSSEDVMFVRGDLNQNSTWVRFRIVCACDGSVNTGSGFYLYGFSMDIPTSSHSSFSYGNIYAQNNVFAGSNVLRGDIAEFFPVDKETEPGTLIAIKEGVADNYTIAEGKGSDMVLGVHSTAPTVTVNNPNSGTPVALAGRVPVKVNNENGPIQIGDYLMVSSTPGEACKAIDNAFVIGRALENTSEEKGKIQCIVQNGFYNATNQALNTRTLGEFTAKKGQAKIVVLDNSVTKDSKIFVSFRAKQGAEHWVSKIELGKFVIEFDKEIKGELPFDYLVENAAINTNSNPNHIEVISEDEMTVMKKKVRKGKEDAVSSINPMPDGESQAVPEANLTQTPNTPPTLDEGWSWTEEKGFFKAINEEGIKKLDAHFIK